MHAIRMFNVVEYIAWQESFYLDSSEIIINGKEQDSRTWYVIMPIYL